MTAQIIHNFLGLSFQSLLIYVIDRYFLVLHGSGSNPPSQIVLLSTVSFKSPPNVIVPFSKFFVPVPVEVAIFGLQCLLTNDKQLVGMGNSSNTVDRIAD